MRDYIAHNGSDYRYEEKPHPIAALAPRTRDNTQVGRSKKEAVGAPRA